MLQANVWSRGIPRRHRAYAICLAGCIVVSILLYAQSASADLSNAGVLDNVLLRYQSAVRGWGNVIQGAASRLFWALASISMVWTFGAMALRKADLQEVLGEFVRFTIFVGFFWWLLKNAVPIAESITTSLRELGARAAGVPNALTPSAIIDVGFEIVFKVYDQSSVWSPIDSTAGIFLALGILCALAYTAVNMLVLLVTSWFLAYAGAFYLGFGGSRWTSEMAIGYYKTILAIGMQLFAMVTLVGIGQSLIDYFHDRLSENVVFKENCVMFVIALVQAYLCNKVPSVLSGIAGAHLHHGLGHGAGAGTVLSVVGVAGAAVGTGAAMMTSVAANAGGAIQAVRAATSAARAELGSRGNTSSTRAGGGPLAAALGDSSSNGRPSPRASGGSASSSGRQAGAGANGHSGGSTAPRAGGSANGAQPPRGVLGDPGAPDLHASPPGRGANGPEPRQSGSAAARPPTRPSGGPAKDDRRDPSDGHSTAEATSGPAGNEAAGGARAETQTHEEAPRAANGGERPEETQGQGGSLELEGTAFSGSPASAPSHSGGADHAESATPDARDQTAPTGLTAARDSALVGGEVVGTESPAGPAGAAAELSQAEARASSRTPPDSSVSRHASGAVAQSERNTAPARSPASAPTRTASAATGTDTIGAGHPKSSSSTGFSSSTTGVSATQDTPRRDGAGSDASDSGNTAVSETGGHEAQPASSPTPREPSGIQVAARATQILAAATVATAKSAAVAAVQRRVDATMGGRIAAAIRESHGPVEPPEPGEIAAFRDGNNEPENTISRGNVRDLNSTRVRPGDDP